MLRGSPMKQNHIPVTQRLQTRIARLSYKISEFSQPIGGGNPYHECRHCGISIPELCTTDGRHRRNCRIPTLAGDLIHYTKLLLDAQKILDPAERQKALDDLRSMFFAAGVAYLLDRKKPS